VRLYLVLTLLAAILVFVACDEKPPDRNQIPIIKARLLKLQNAVKDQDRARLDSLLSVEILDYQLSGDSLLSYVYGPNRDFAFEQFALGEIRYTEDIAKIDCYIMDTLHLRDRPLHMTYTKDGRAWLLKKFEPGDTLR